MTLTEDNIISLGLQAEAILKDDSFNELFKFVVDDTVQSILATTIEEAAKRENLYSTVNGMRYFTERLQQIVLAKENIISKRNADEGY